VQREKRSGLLSYGAAYVRDGERGADLWNIVQDCGQCWGKSRRCSLKHLSKCCGDIESRSLHKGISWLLHGLVWQSIEDILAILFNVMLIRIWGTNYLEDLQFFLLETIQEETKSFSKSRGVSRYDLVTLFFSLVASSLTPIPKLSGFGIPSLHIENKKGFHLTSIQRIQRTTISAIRSSLSLQLLMTFIREYEKPHKTTL
jgi:hypothetical protein